MDWDKVIERMREISNHHAKQANEYSMKSGMYDAVKQHRLACDIFAGMAAALGAGRQPQNDEKRAVA
jgi:hypothetical protein